MWTKSDFVKFTGKEPIQDDLERANCPDAGKLGHHQCGVCAEHSLPVFMCPVCLGYPFETVKLKKI